MKKTKYDFTTLNPRSRTVENVGRMEIKNDASGAHLYIYGDIVNTEWDKWTPEDTFPQGVADFLAQIDADAPLTVYVNSGGGDVFGGIAIYHIIKRHNGKKTAVVDALAASIASVIIMACDEIIVNSGAQIMIHKPSARMVGTADDFRMLADELDKCQKSITDIYMARVREGITEDYISSLINSETWFNGSEASAIFTNIAVNNLPALAAYAGNYLNRYKNKPAELKTAEIPEFEDGQRDAAAEILEDLYLYGT